MNSPPSSTLQQSFEQLFSLSPVSVGISRLRDGCFTQVNDAFEQLHGIAQDKAIGRTDVELGLWANPAERERLMAALRQHGKVRDYVHYVHVPSGRICRGLAAMEIIDLAGEQHVLCILADVSEIEDARKALEDSNRQLKLAVKAGRIGLWDLDYATGRVWLSYGHASIFGKPLPNHESSLDRILERVHPDDRENLRTSIAEAPSSTIREAVCRVLGADGEVRWVLARGEVIRDAVGNPVRLMGAVRDITEEHRAAEMLQLHSAILHNMKEGVMLAREDNGIIIFANPTFEGFFGYGSGGLNGKHVSILNAPREGGGANVSADIMATLRGNGVWQGELQNIRRDGSLFWSHATVSPLEHREHGRIHVTVQQDITDRKYAEAERERLARVVAEQAIRDALTGLFNRRYMDETVAREIAEAGRLGHPISFLMLDIDRFKQVNDSYGHKAGDAILESLGRLLREHIRGGDIACRYGGEEFLLVLPGASPEMAMHRADQLRQAVEAMRVACEDHVLGVTISGGIAAYPRHGQTGDAVISAADNALYAAKAAGRNRIISAPMQ